MANFNRDNRSSRGRDFGGGRSKSSMHQAICSDCGKECEVPFRPTGDRPVFCNVCFENHRGETSGRTGGKSYSRPSFGNKPMFEAVCDKCGKKCEVPFRPSGDKPVYCSQCFDKGDSNRGRGAPQSKEQFEMLNAKLDKILKILNPVLSAETTQAKKANKEIKETPAVKQSLLRDKQKSGKNSLTKIKAAFKKAAKKKKK